MDNLDLWDLRYEVLKEFKEVLDLLRNKAPSREEYEELKRWAMKLYCTIDQLSRLPSDPFPEQ